MGFENTKDFVSGDETDLRDTMRVTEDDTDLGRSHALTSKLGDLFDDLFWGSFKPRRRGSAVRQSRGRWLISFSKYIHLQVGQHTNALARSVHATHFESRAIIISKNYYHYLLLSVHTIIEGGRWS